jgi:hypothetical protein
MSMKNSSDTIGNRARDLPTFSAVPQPTALPRVPIHLVSFIFIVRQIRNKQTDKYGIKAYRRLNLGGKNPLYMPQPQTGTNEITPTIQNLFISRVMSLLF